MPIRSTDLIEVKQTARKGRGVFARQFIPKGTEFEQVPVLVMPAEEVLGEPVNSVLQHYVFDWGKGTVALALGFGSCYNHSYQPNARYDDYGRMMKVFSALKDIQPGEEITINYNGHQDDDSPVWFEVVESTPAADSASNGNEKKKSERSRSGKKRSSGSKRRTLAG
ncbi:MAG: SET domain-containing protein-lysine N-methyltransferase [Planctomycetaceae bacterium]|nr:SET domain-containing protein-lysine N-methyltransferase [Planctomycetaceae bacterium]